MPKYQRVHQVVKELCREKKDALEVRKAFDAAPYPNDPEKCPVELRESNIDGRGVFAKRDIKPGEIVTYYPGHIFLKTGEKCNTGELRDVPLAESGVYTYYCRGYHIIGKPWQTDDPWNIGHMINDGASLTCSEEDRLQDVSDAAVDYMRNAYEKNNVQFTSFMYQDVPVVSAVRALKRIRAGEELFVAYDFAYWLSKCDNRYPSEVVILVNVAKFRAVFQMMKKGDVKPFVNIS